jgi:hypothetical protein
MEESMTNLSYAPDIEGMFHTGGGGFGGSVYAAYDKVRHRGVVIFSTVGCSGPEVGSFLLESQWQSDRRPTATNIDRQVFNSYAGQYQRSPGMALGIFVIRQYFPVVPKAAIYIPAGLCLGTLTVLLWRAGSSRRRWLILGGALLICGLFAPLVVLVSGHIFCERFQPGISIRTEGDRLIAQATGQNLCPIEELQLRQAWGNQSHTIDVLFPRVVTELLAESESRFFEKLSAVPITFSRNAGGKVTGLTLHYRGKMISYEKISDEPPKAPELPKRPVPIKLDTKLLDACVGRYEFVPNAMFPDGIKMTIWREGDHLMQQAWGQPLIPQAVRMYPESETNFFDKIYAMRMTFIKNDQGEVTGVVNHYSGNADCEGEKLKN